MIKRKKKRIRMRDKEERRKGFMKKENHENEDE
jgi:hypothetical protein